MTAREALTAEIAQALAEHRSIPGHVRYVAKDCTVDAETVMAVVWPVIEQAHRVSDDKRAEVRRLENELEDANSMIEQARQQRDDYRDMWKNEHVINRDLIAQRDETPSAPSMDAVRDFYVDHRVPTYPWTRFGEDEIAAAESAQAEFDRALARERARWQAEALRDAARDLETKIEKEGI